LFFIYAYTRFAQITTSSYEYFLTDALGSVRQMVDETGELTLAQAYQPYGETLHSSGSGASPYGFAGEYTDSQTGLQYLRARDYAPGVGRFLTKDMWAGDDIQPMSYNPWLYVYANPINLTDPSGMCVGINCHSDGGTALSGVSSISALLSAPTSLTSNQTMFSYNSNPCQPGVINPEPDLPPDPAQLTSGGKAALQSFEAFRNTRGWWWVPRTNEFTIMTVLAIAINYERSDLFDINTHAKQNEEKFIEAFGRSYWDKCKGGKCQISNGYPDAALLNFLGLTAFKNHNPSNTPITDHNFPRAFEIADRVLYPSGTDATWIDGWYLNNPAHWGNLVSTNPLWFKNWVTYAQNGRRADPHMGSDPHQILFSSGPNTGNTFYMLTPAQATAHCGKAPSCVQMTDANGPRPEEWVHSSYGKP
jgi:RHS repeat-associated protein